MGMIGGTRLGFIVTYAEVVHRRHPVARPPMDAPRHTLRPARE